MAQTATLEERLRQYEDWLAKIVYADMLTSVTGDEEVTDAIAEVIEEAKVAGAGFDGFIRKAAASLAKDVMTKRYGNWTEELAELLH